MCIIHVSATHVHVCITHSSSEGPGLWTRFREWLLWINQVVEYMYVSLGSVWINECGISLTTDRTNWYIFDHRQNQLIHLWSQTEPIDTSLTTDRTNWTIGTFLTTDRTKWYIFNHRQNQLIHLWSQTEPNDTSLTTDRTNWYIFDHRQNQIVRNPLPLIL